MCVYHNIALIMWPLGNPINTLRLLLHIWRNGMFQRIQYSFSDKISVTYVIVWIYTALICSMLPTMQCILYTFMNIYVIYIHRRSRMSSISSKFLQKFRKTRFQGTITFLSNTQYYFVREYGSSHIYICTYSIIVCM